MVNGFVFILESPSDEDLLDERMEGKALSTAFNLASIPHAYNLVTTKKALIKALTWKLHEAIKEHNKAPILHISMHGNDEGVGLTDGEFVSWDDLRKELTPLLNNMQGGLLICMSSCYGGSGCRMAMHEEADHPFWALVGNSEAALWSDAAVAYITFYHLFFKGVGVEDAVAAMKVASGDGNFMVFNGDFVKKDWSGFISEKKVTAGLFSLMNPGKNSVLGK
jgi:hypothetical protein